MNRVSAVELHSNYLTQLKDFINKTMYYTQEHSSSFEDERATLLKDANLLQKEKNNKNYKKDKHKKHKYNDGY